jgi:hypothetical protein
MAMYRAAGLTLASLVFSAIQAAAQVSPFPTVNSGGGVLIQQGTAGSPVLTPLQRQDHTRHSIQQQSCSGMSGQAAARCDSELRATIESDKLKQQAIESGQRREK